MKSLVWFSLLCCALGCGAQTRCDSAAMGQTAGRVLAVQDALRHVKVEDMNEDVPAAAASQMVELKDALSRATDAALRCEESSVDPAGLQTRLAQAWHANMPKDSKSGADAKAEKSAYGQDLDVTVSRPAGLDHLLTVAYSTTVECGSDSALLVYEFRNGAWVQRLRWQAPELKSISDAFGDFFQFAILRTSAARANDEGWRVAVAHGTPWCTSRFSGFKIDVLAPGTDVAAPRVLWHTARGYSRADFSPRMTSEGDTFELRLNADCMAFDVDRCFERRVIYRYRLDDKDAVRRVGPIGLNARGFVEEWLAAPWDEARELSEAEGAGALKEVHEQFEGTNKKSDRQFVSHSLGPVQRCKEAGTFQVQINSTLKTMVPGKPGGDSEAMQSRYFHVREMKDGYVMLTASTEPDPMCSGPDLMPKEE